MLFVNQKKWIYKRIIRETKRLKLGFNNLYIFPNLFGIYWIVTAIVIYILGLNLENNFTVFISYLMISVLVISLFLTHFNIHGLELISTTQEIKFANSIINYKIILFSKKYRNNIKLKFLNKQNKFISIDSIEGKTINHLPLRSKRRGIYKPDIIYGESSAPFSLFNCWFYWKPVDKLIIAPEKKRGRFFSEFKNSEEYIKSRDYKTLVGEDLQELHPYKKGEKKSLIHWKSLARSNNLLSKDFKQKLSSKTWLVLNKNSPLEISLQNLCFQIHIHYLSRDSFGVKLSENKLIYPDKSKKHYLKCLKMLAGYKNE